MGSPVCVALAVSKETQDQIDKMEQEKQEAEEQKKETEKEKDKLNHAKTEMEGYLSSLEKQSKSLNEQISILTGDIETKEAEVASKEEEIGKAQEELDEQYDKMKKRIQYMYENGQGNMMMFLAASLEQGTANLLNQVEYAAYVSGRDREMLKDFETAKQNLEKQKTELESERQALDLLKKETEEKKQKVAAQQKATGSKLSAYNELLQQKLGELLTAEELVKEKTRILNELIAKAKEEERLAKIHAAQNAASSMNGVTIIAGDPQISKGNISLSDYELMLLATMIYCEAGNQGMEGQLAVGYVIMNRVRSTRFPNSLEAVLRQSKQFEPVGSGRFDLVLQAEQDPDIPNIVTQSCWNAAAAVVNGTSNVGDSLFFRTWAPVPQLITNLENGKVPYWIIKDHIFYYYWTSYSNQKPSEKPKDEEEEPEEEEKPEEQEPEEQPKPEEQKPEEQPKPEEQKPEEQPKPEEQKPEEQPKPEEQKPEGTQQPQTDGSTGQTGAGGEAPAQGETGTTSPNGQKEADSL